MIIWIASYPKSGNTWVRSFLSTLLHSKNGENDFKHLNKIKQFPAISQFKGLVKDYENVNELAKNWILAQQSINLDEKVKLFKTHHVNCKIGKYGFTDDNNSLGVIHVVRDPRNVITSLKNHFSLSNNDLAKKFIFDEQMWVGFKDKLDVEKDNKIPTLISSWKTHYFSWKNKSKNYFLVRYEDLIKNPSQKFHEIAKYVSKLMRVDFENEKIDKAISSNSFESLKKLEKNGMFKESALVKSLNQKVNFFHLGPKNSWQNILDQKTIDEIEEKFYSEMKELNYI